MSDISRSVYQKVCEENKKLLSDIMILVSTDLQLISDKRLLIKKWRYKFQKEKQFNDLLKQFATQYFKDHPELDIIKTRSKIL